MRKLLLTIALLALPGLALAQGGTPAGGYNTGANGTSSSSLSPSNDLRLGISLYDDFMGGSPGAPQGSGTIAFSTAGSGSTAAQVITQSVPLVIAAGSTAIISISTSANGAGICGIGGTQDTGQGISDDGGNLWVQLSVLTTTPLNPPFHVCTELWGTSPPSQAKAATTITLTPFNTFVSATAATYTGIKSYGQIVPITGAVNTAVTASVTTQDANNFVVCGFGWFLGSADAFTIGTGNARANITASPPLGSVLTDNTVASPGALVNSGTLASSTSWGGACVELRTVQPMIVTSGNIGQLAWASSGIGNTNQVPTVPVPGAAGVLQLQTGTASGNNANIYLPNNGVNTFPVNDATFDFVARVQLPIGHTTTTSLFCGLQVNPVYFPGESATDFVGIGFNTVLADTNFMYLTRAIYGNAVRTSSGIAVDNQWHDFRVRSITPGVVLFSIDGGTEVASTVALSYTPMALSCNVFTRAAATRFANIDFIQFKEYTIR